MSIDLATEKKDDFFLSQVNLYYQLVNVVIMSILKVQIQNPQKALCMRSAV